MTAFFPILNQMLFLFLCMFIGYLLNRTHLLADDGDTVLSHLLNYAFVPAMIINSFKVQFTIGNLKANMAAIACCAAIVAITFPIALVLAPRFSEAPEDNGIYRYSIIITNFGFMGNSMVQGLFGNEALARFLVFSLPAQIFVYTIGVIDLTAGKRKFSWKMLVNPMFISLLIGMIAGLTSISVPPFIQKTLDGFVSCYSPVAMILSGYVIARFDLLTLIKKKNIYLLTILRLVILPLFIFGLCRLFRIPEDITRMAMIFSSMPLGLNTIVFPSAYGGNETPGASMAIISNVIGLITVPLMLSLVF